LRLETDHFVFYYMAILAKPQIIVSDRTKFEIKKKKKLLCVKKCIKMGLFSDTQQTVVVAQTANGKATAEISVPLPLWEIILITIIVSVIIFTLCSSIKKKFGKYVSKQANKISLETV
jgi:hypothetical protein